VSTAPIQAEVRRILVVDDHPASRYATVRVLSAAGFEVLQAETGSEALDKAQQDIDLIVLDVNLPDIDGFEVCKRLRSRPATADIPVTYLSATFTNRVDIRHGLLSGADSYLTHPADPVALVATIRALLFARDAATVKRRADTRFRTIFDLTSGGIALLDAQLTFRDVNPAFCEICGRTARTLRGASIVAVAGEQFAMKLQQINAELASQGRWEGLVPLQHADGSEGLSEWRIVVEADTGARIAMVTDVTARMRGERERERLLTSERTARAEADRSNQMKDEFLAMLSHELRNPLSAILGWATLLKRTPELPPLVRQGVDAIERNSRVQSHLTSDLLDFAGIQFGKMRLEMGAVNPQAVVDAAIEIIAPQAESRQIRLAQVQRAEDCSVMGDEARLQQVVWNLLSNAVKFTPSGGRIDVATRVSDGWFELDVTDTGKGISPEFLPRLFDRFSQQESGASKAFSGLGIGLTIVRHLVARHQGSIKALSAGEGKGATFRVRLPLAETALSPVLQAAPVSLEGLDVLIVEDVQDTRELIARLLAEAGARVREADSGDGALLQVRSAKPDVLVSDIGMPGKDGYELMRTLRTEGYSAQALPAIALTAFARIEERSAALEAGYQMHLGKPVNNQALIAAIARLHRESGPQGNASSQGAP